VAITATNQDGLTQVAYIWFSLVAFNYRREHMYPETILPIVAHIPHAGTEIPDAVRDQFLPDSKEVWREVAVVTDWYTDELFGLPGIARIQTPISRVVLDLERFVDDKQESQAVVGQGVIYSHDSRGRQIRRTLLDEERHALLDNYYHPWHTKLELDIEQQLDRWGHCLLLDCHSFPTEAFENRAPYEIPPPDICLGIHSANTPQWLIDSCHRFFLNRGYSVAINFPYAGCLVPERFERNHRVPAIMLEVNRGLYLKPACGEEYRLDSMPIKTVSFEKLRNDVWAAMLLLAQETHCRAKEFKNKE
jgi:N-formylglutamate deformylase